MAKLDGFLDVMFHTSDQTHLWHLQTKSHELHLVLGGYYDGVRGLLDRFAEACMGRKGIRLQAKGGVPLVALKGADQVVSHIEGISRWCDGLHAEIAVGGKDQFLEAIIEDLQEHIAKTMYLLTLQ